MREFMCVLCGLGLSVGLTKIIIDASQNRFPWGRDPWDDEWKSKLKKPWRIRIWYERRKKRFQRPLKYLGHLPRRLKLLACFLDLVAVRSGGTNGKYGFYFHFMIGRVPKEWRFTRYYSGKYWKACPWPPHQRWWMFAFKPLCKLNARLNDKPLPPAKKKIEYKPTGAREYMRTQFGFPENYAAHNCGGIQFCSRGTHLILQGEQCRICAPHRPIQPPFPLRYEPIWFYKLRKRKQLLEYRDSCREMHIKNRQVHQRARLMLEIREEIAMIRWINCFPECFWMYRGVMDCWKRTKSGELIYCGPAFFVTNFGDKRFVWSELEKKIPMSKIP